jgi:transposase
MIPIPSGVRVWLATGHTDMRRGFPSLALQVQEVLKHDPLGGHLFCFRGRRSDLIKIIWHDSQGACLFTKRLERGRFIWPSATGEAVTISQAQLLTYCLGSTGEILKKLCVQRELDSILQLNLPENLIHWLHEFEAG